MATESEEFIVSRLCKLFQIVSDCVCSACTVFTLLVCVIRCYSRLTWMCRSCISQVVICLLHSWVLVLCLLCKTSNLFLLHWALCNSLLAHELILLHVQFSGNLFRAAALQLS